MTKQNLKLETDLRWDAAEEQWTASAPDSAGKMMTYKGKSPTQAMRRLTTMLSQDYDRPVDLAPKLHLPRELQSAYNEYQKKFKQFTELKQYINTARKELGFKMIDHFDIPITTVAPLLGLSAQRLGMMKQEWEMGITRGSVGRPRKHADDDD